MREIELTQQQRNDLCYQLAELYDQRGKLSLDCEIDNIEVHADGWRVADGYMDEGELVTTQHDAWYSLSTRAYNDETGGYESVMLDQQTYREIEQILSEL